ncbi:hypothetical protein [Rhodoblastus sp.]|uniref:hypothetical protein n=1 Tax=Rhodoblastus sp. TaxID=1962975 RepID=UPI003F9ADC35
MSTAVKSVPGGPFQEVLALLMAHALGGAESESDPFVLSRLVREYIAWALALYYQCDHCNHHHHRAIVALQKKEQEPQWPWEPVIAEVVLFTRARQSDVSSEEWRVWERQWSRLTHILSTENARIVTLILFAIGMARDDKDLVRLAFGSAAGMCADKTRLPGVVRDVFRVVVAMKAATTQFRMEADIKALLAKQHAESA